MVWFKQFYAKRQMEKRIRQLSLEERKAIIEKSPYEAAGFQGEGFHVFLKSEPDFKKGFITSLGEISGTEAEDWIIKTYLEENP